MADNWALKGVSRDDERSTSGAAMTAVQPKASSDDPVSEVAGLAPRKSARPRPPLGNLVSIAVGIVGLAALGATAWVYAETQRDIRRVANDIAQIRVSLELYGRQQSGGGATAASNTDSDARLLDLSNRLALLEANQRNGGAAAAASAIPALPAATTGAVATGGDCLPVGTRFMVAAGDNYAVCGTTAKVSIAAIDNGFITLADGTVIAEGGTINLAGTQCMLGVVPSDGDGLSGYAEIRVAC